MSKKINIHQLREMKSQHRKVVFITCYDYPFALLADRAGVDMILIGDSLAMTTLGYKNTISIDMKVMLHHAKAVSRAVNKAFLVGDMPFMSYQPSDRDAVINAGRFLSEANCDAVKLEGGCRIASRVKAITDAGIAVMGHIGLTPQSTAQMGGYRIQGRTLDSYQALLDDALALQEAGAFSILLEAIPEDVAEILVKKTKIPIYGIGAGVKVDGQLVIIHDIIGLFEQFKPKFIKQFCNAGKVIESGIVEYANAVREGKFPQKENCYEIAEDNLEEILKYSEIN